MSDILGNVANEWTPESGFFSDELKRDPYSTPRPAIGTGSELGLTLVLNADINEYYCSSTNSYGFKVRIHSPNETPKMAHYGISVANGFESNMVVTPTISEASYTVRSIPKDVRQCIFEDENMLSYYRYILHKSSK